MLCILILLHFDCWSCILSFSPASSFLVLHPLSYFCILSLSPASSLLVLHLHSWSCTAFRQWESLQPQCHACAMQQTVPSSESSAGPGVKMQDQTRNAYTTLNCFLCIELGMHGLSQTPLTTQPVCCWKMQQDTTGNATRGDDRDCTWLAGLSG